MRLFRLKRYAMNISANFGSLRSVVSITSLVMEVIRHSSNVTVVEMRRGWPLRHPSPKNWPSSQDSNHCFLALFGEHQNLDFSFLNVEDLIRDGALDEYDLAPVTLQQSFALADLDKEFLRIENAFCSVWQRHQRMIAV
jgi:hypothetical protein